MDYKFKAKLWEYQGKGAWHFVTLPQEIGQEIRANFGGAAGGWGSIKVKVSLGKSTWATSIFPDNKSDSYLLPIKSEIRKENQIIGGDLIYLTLRLKI